MRIIFLSYNYSPGIHSPQEWVERIKYYIGWLQCLAKEHQVIRIDQIDHTGEFTHHGVQYYFVDDGKKKNYFPRKLNQFVRSLQPDIVVVSSFLFPLQVIQLRICLGKNVKVISQHHAEKPFTGIKKHLQKLAAQKTDAFLFTSRETGADWVRKGNLDSEKKIRELMEVSSVFYPIDKKTAKEKTGATGSPVFLWVGRLDQNKDPLTAVKAFLKFSAGKPAAKLFMIYHTAELLSQIKAFLPTPYSPLANPIVLIGKISHTELLYWFNSADFYLSASHYEGSGTSLSEALSCGCVPIVTDIPSFRKISDNCGLLYEPGNEEALVMALQHSMDLNLETQRQKAVAHFKRELSFEAIAITFQQILASL